MEKPEDIDGKEYKRQEAETDETLKKSSPAKAVKGKIADLHQKLASDSSSANRAGQAARSRQIPRREALKTLGKAALAAPFIIQGIKERILANEGNPYYSHGVSEELRILANYRVDSIHRRPAEYVRQVLRDMTNEKNERSRKYQEETLKKHLRTESSDTRLTGDYFSGYQRVRSARALHIEGNDYDYTTHSRRNNGDVEIRVYYYPDAANRKIEGKLTISPRRYTRRHHGITETVENPGSIKEEVEKLRELLLGKNPAIAETEKMIEEMNDIEARPFPVLEKIRQLPETEQKPLFEKLKDKLSAIVQKTPDLEGFKLNGMNMPEQTAIMLYHPVDKLYSWFILQPTKKAVSYGSLNKSQPRNEEPADNYYSFGMVIDKMREIAG